MCLYYQSPKPKKLKSYRERYGWKKFSRDFYDPDNPNILEFPYQIFQGKSNVPRGKWLHETKKKTITDNNHKRYVPKFHVYLKRPDCLSLGVAVIKKVRWRGPVATGYQDKLPVVVASWLKVP